MPIGIYTRTVEARMNMSKAHKGKVLSERHKLNIGKSCKGLPQSDEKKRKISLAMLGENNHQWKGGKAHYRNVHIFLNKYFGKVTFCENALYDLFPFRCGLSKSFDWAKKIGKEYTKNRDDYYKLCRACHAKYDKKCVK